ncbi:MAG: TRAP transporter small permease subunit [Candidatus Goldbacteria bacterium]|nr:TRAP transporter small permease subunit [Candidatus Goldiibacteriota bacterium]
MNLLRKINYRLYKFQKTFVVVLFLTLLVLAFLQVVLRLFFRSGIESADSIVRYLVLWVGFLGASLATYKNRHINIDITSQFFKKLNKKVVSIIINFISLAVSILFLTAAVIFIINEFNSSTKITFIPIWILELILPLTFSFITLSFLQKFIESVIMVRKGK